MWIIWKIKSVILFKRNMAEKDVCHAHTFCSLDCNFFLYFFTPAVTPEGKKGIRLSPSSPTSFYYFFIFWFKNTASKLNLRLSSHLQ